MNQPYWNDPKTPAYDITGAGPVTLQSFLTQVYTWMALGLALSGFTAMAVASIPVLTNFVYGTPFVFFGLVIAELALVFAFSRSAARGGEFGTLLAMFLAYSALNGVTLSSILLVYTHASITKTFFIAGATFAGAGFFGLVAKKDLTGVGHFARMGLWGIIIAMIVNIFMGSTVIEMAISLIGVFVFVLLSAYDTQKLKQIHAHFAHDESSLKRTALQGALSLYLDFINLFLFLLRLFGNRK